MTEATERLHFLDYWRVVRARWEIVVAVTLLAFITGTAITLTLPKEYMSSTRVLVQQETPDMSAFGKDAMWHYDPFFLRTEYEIIQSKPVLYEVIRRTNLRENWGKYYGVGEPLAQLSTYNQLRSCMRVHQYRDTNLVEIQIRLSTPKEAEPWEEAARIANAVAKVYADQRLQRKSEELERGIESLRHELEKQQRKVAVAEAKLQKERVSGGISFVGNVQLDKQTLATLQASRSMARVDMLVRKAHLAEVEALSDEALRSAVGHIASDPEVQRLSRQLMDAEMSLAVLDETYGPNWPDIKRAKTARTKTMTELASALEGLRMGLRADYRVAIAKFEAIEAELNAAKSSDIDAEGNRYLPFRNATEHLFLQRQILAALQTRLSQEGIEMELPRTPVTVVDRAEPVDRPIGPHLFMNIVISLVLGLGAGVCLAFLIEYLDTSVKTVEEIERLLGMSVLGVIPQRVGTLVEEGPESPHAEAYRVLRTNMHFSSKTTGGKTFAITSGGAGEGKSLTLFNLAYVNALLGDKVLVVDSDFRRPTQHKMFGVRNDKGLVQVLLGDAKIEDIIQGTKIPNLHFMPSGRIRNPALSLLDSHKMLDLVKSLKLRYDLVFFDTPPVVGVSDASVLASEVDGVLLVIQHRKYPRAVSSRAKSLVENVGGNLVGVVLNNINITKDYYSYYYYHAAYDYPYGYGPREDDEDEEEDEAAVSSDTQSEG